MDFKVVGVASVAALVLGVIGYSVVKTKRSIKTSTNPLDDKKFLIRVLEQLRSQIFSLCIEKAGFIKKFWEDKKKQNRGQAEIQDLTHKLSLQIYERKQGYVLLKYGCTKEQLQVALNKTFINDKDIQLYSEAIQDMLLLMANGKIPDINVPADLKNILTPQRTFILHRDLSIILLEKLLQALAVQIQDNPQFSMKDKESMIQLLQKVNLYELKIQFITSQIPQIKNFEYFNFVKLTQLYKRTNKLFQQKLQQLSDIYAEFFEKEIVFEDSKKRFLNVRFEEEKKVVNVTQKVVLQKEEVKQEQIKQEQAAKAHHSVTQSVEEIKESKVESPQQKVQQIPKVTSITNSVGSEFQNIVVEDQKDNTQPNIQRQHTDVQQIPKQQHQEQHIEQVSLQVAEQVLNSLGNQSKSQEQPAKQGIAQQQTQKVVQPVVQSTIQVPAVVETQNIPQIVKNQPVESNEQKVQESFPQAVINTQNQPVSQPAAEPIEQPVQQISHQNTAEIIPKSEQSHVENTSNLQKLAQNITQPVVDPISEPAVEPKTQSIVQSIAETIPDNKPLTEEPVEQVVENNTNDNVQQTEKQEVKVQEQAPTENENTQTVTQQTVQSKHQTASQQQNNEQQNNTQQKPEEKSVQQQGQQQQQKQNQPQPQEKQEESQIQPEQQPQPQKQKVAQQTQTANVDVVETQQTQSESIKDQTISQSTEMTATVDPTSEQNTSQKRIQTEQSIPAENEPKEQKEKEDNEHKEQKKEGKKKNKKNKNR